MRPGNRYRGGDDGEGQHGYVRQATKQAAKALLFAGIPRCSCRIAGSNNEAVFYFDFGNSQYLRNYAVLPGWHFAAQVKSRSLDAAPDLASTVAGISPLSGGVPDPR